MPFNDVILRPMLPILTGLMAGIATAYGVEVPVTPVLVAFGAVTALLLALTFLGRRIPAFALSVAAFFLLGMLLMSAVMHPEPDPLDVRRFEGSRGLVLEGIVAESPESSPERSRMVVETRSVVSEGRRHTARGKVLLVTRGETGPFQYGDVIRADARLHSPRGFQNPGAFDYAKHLRLRGISTQGAVDDPASILLVREGYGNAFLQRIESFRSEQKKIIHAAAAAPESGILEALILGERGGIPKDLQEKFNRTGTTHILSISGLHVSIVILVSLWIARLALQSSEAFLLRFDLTRSAAFLSLIPVFFYAFVAGMSIPTVRSVLMVVAFLFAVLIGRQRELMNTLALAAFGILLFAPGALFDISFQLSFAAVAAMIHLTPRLDIHIRRLKPDALEEGSPKKWLRASAVSILLFLSASLAATLGTAPLVAYYFNRLSLISLAANLAVVPVLGFAVLILGMAAMTISFLSESLAAPVYTLAAFFVGRSLDLVDFFHAVPGSSITLTTPSMTEMTAFYLLLDASENLLKAFSDDRGTGGLRDFFRRHRARIAALSALGFFFAADGLYLHLKNRNTGTLRATFLDVGHGSATLLELPGGKKMLVDGGGHYDGRFDIGRYVVAPFLWKQRVDRLDRVVLTHPHPDHLNGLLFVILNFEVGEVWTNGERADSLPYREFMETLRRKGIPVREVGRGCRESHDGGLTLEVFHPPKPLRAGDAPLTDSESNNASLVMRVSYGLQGILLAGDISEPSETQLARSAADLRSTVLLAPHHASRQSCTTPFLRRVHPDITVISAKERPTLRIPHPEALERLKGVGSAVFRTDIHGAVIVETDGRAVRVHTHNPM